LNGQGYVLRLHPFGGSFGDPQDWACTVERDGETALIHGAAESPGAHAKIAMTLRNHGFKRVRWYRADKGWVEFNL